MRALVVTIGSVALGAAAPSSPRWSSPLSSVSRFLARARRSDTDNRRGSSPWPDKGQSVRNNLPQCRLP
jgi:hypothetical protein